VKLLGGQISLIVPVSTHAESAKIMKDLVGRAAGAFGQLLEQVPAIRVQNIEVEAARIDAASSRRTLYLTRSSFSVV
jgi:hypothetical protein